MNASLNIAQKAILVREDGKVLALRRSKTDPLRPLTWDLPGGEIEHGEDLTEAIKREVREETGLTVETLALLDVVGFVVPSGAYWVSIGYVAQVPQDAAVTLSFEHDEFTWLTKEEFLKRESTDRIKRFLKKAPTQR